MKPRHQQPAAGAYPEYVRTEEDKRAFRRYLGDESFSVIGTYARLRAEMLGVTRKPLYNWTEVQKAQ